MLDTAVEDGAWLEAELVGPDLERAALALAYDAAALNPNN